VLHWVAGFTDCSVSREHGPWTPQPMKMKALCSLKTSVSLRPPTEWNVPEDRIDQGDALLPLI